MSKRYHTNNWTKAIDDLEWLVKEIQDEQKCIEQKIIDEPLSGFNGFWYGLVKDFELDVGDEEALMAMICTANHLSDQLKADKFKPYVFDSAEQLINVLRKTIEHIISFKSKAANIKSSNN